jgi:NAD(P)-dependent dehydrogenase (short-subunit alcohol dehydrogenase family)
VLTDIDDARGQELVAGIRSAGNEALYLSLDVTDETPWPEIVVEFERRYGRLDILVANAGIGIMCTSIAEMSLADWRRQTAVNLDGVFLSVKHCLPLMRRSGGGSIVMTSPETRPQNPDRPWRLARPNAASGQETYRDLLAALPARRSRSESFATANGLQTRQGHRHRGRHQGASLVAGRRSHRHPRLC